MAGRRAGLTLVDVVVLGVVLAVVATIAAPALSRRAGRRHSESKTLNNLRQIGLAAISYADAARNRFPHVGQFTSTDGSFDSDTSARCLRALTYSGLIDDPALFVDPASNDRETAAPITSRSFSWSPDEPETGADSPLVRAGAHDRPLTELTTLSYAWTRKGVNANCRCDHVLAGDRARRVNGDTGRHTGNLIGNREDAFRVVYSDGRTGVIQPAGDRFATRIAPDPRGPPSLMGTGHPDDGFLGALADDE